MFIDSLPASSQLRMQALAGYWPDGTRNGMRVRDLTPVAYAR
jgi:hypothetical protein